MGRNHGGLQSSIFHIDAEEWAFDAATSPFFDLHEDSEPTDVLLHHAQQIGQ